MSPEQPDDWHEPVNEALWRHHQILGVPPVCMLQWLLWLFVAALAASFTPLIYAAIVHGVCFWLTVVDPEWTKVLSAYLSEPEELDW